MKQFVDFLEGPYDAAEEFNLTLVVSRDEDSGRDSVLLGRKQHGYGEGMLVLPGGKDIYYLGAGHLALLPGNHSAAREVLQETGLAVDPNELPLVGTLHVIGDGDEKEVRIYRHDCTGNPKLTGCDELSNPAWYPTQRIPYGRMPRDYSLWLPQLLEGDSVTAFLEVDGDSTYGAVYHAKIDPPGRLQEISITPEP